MRAPRSTHSKPSLRRVFMRADRTRSPFEETFQGLAASPGIAVGTALRLDPHVASVPRLRLREAEVDHELTRFEAALAQARQEIEGLLSALPDRETEDLAGILEAHLTMLRGGRLLRGTRERIGAERLNAEAALDACLKDIAEGFRALPNAVIADRLSDVEDVVHRVQRALAGTPERALPELEPDTVIFAEDISPGEAARLDPARVAAVVAALGGAHGHTAIMARALGIPTVLGCAGAFRHVETGMPVIVDGSAGTVILRPREASLAAARRQRKAEEAETAALQAMAGLAAITRDGSPIALEANVELPLEVDGALEAGADGIGLLRSEFLFLGRETLPGEEEQTAALTQILAAMERRPVTVRTVDIGGDKIAQSLRGTPWSGAAGDNPALGLRAIRLSLRLRSLFETQIAAILRAWAATGGPVRILLPMITSPEEVREARAIVHSVARRLRARGLALPHSLPPIGAMIEVPAAALGADGLAREADFFSIGSNDLTMYTLAIDRGNEQVAHLYDPLNPAVLRLLQFTTSAAHRAGIDVSICGEIAAEPRYTALLLGLGLRALSMVPSAIARVKSRVREIDVTEAERLAHGIVGETHSATIAERLDRFNAALGTEAASAEA